MKTALLKLINIGAISDNQFENRRIVSSNLLSVISLVITACYTVFYLLVSWWQPVFVYIPFFTLSFYCLYLNHKGFNRLSPIIALFALTVKLSIFTVLFLGREVGLHFFLIVLPAASFLTVSKKDKIWSIIYIVFSYSAFLLAEYSYGPPPFTSDIIGEYVNLLRIFSLSGVMASIAVLILFFHISLNRAQGKLIIEHQRAEKLLFNILPIPIAQRLKTDQQSIAEAFPATTILFADIVGFTSFSKNVAPASLVSILNQIFSRFDNLTDKYGLEKIKTIGDAYMVAGGIPTPSDNHVESVANMGLEMQRELSRFNEEYNYSFQLRIGIHTGEAVAGVIGIKKFSYDLWGDTVNTASRMESQGIPGEIQVSEDTYTILRDKFQLQERGVIDVKGKGEMRVFLLQGRKTQ